MSQLFAEVCSRWQAHAAPPMPQPRWVPVQERFPLIAMVDGSTSEALLKSPRCCGSVKA